MTDRLFMGNTETIRLSSSLCVRCSAPVKPRFRPFCSARCSQLDLAKWLNESYRIPLEQDDEN